jgi:hypothetical protein
MTPQERRRVQAKELSLTRRMKALADLCLKSPSPSSKKGRAISSELHRLQDGGEENKWKKEERLKIGAWLGLIAKLPHSWFGAEAKRLMKSYFPAPSWQCHKNGNGKPK